MLCSVPRLQLLKHFLLTYVPGAVRSKVFTNRKSFNLIITYYPHFTGGETETQKDDVTPQGQTAAQRQSRGWHQAVWLWGPYSEPVSDAACLQGGAARHLWGPGGLAMKSSKPRTRKSSFTCRLSPLLARGPYTKVLNLGGSQAPCAPPAHSPSG